ncbi:unnamed protein product [Prunus brigantina]
MVSSFTRAQLTAFSRALEFAKREGIRSLRLRHVNMYGNLAANLLARIPLQPQQERSWSGRNKWNSSEGCDRSLDPFLGPMSESSFG